MSKNSPQYLYQKRPELFGLKESGKSQHHFLNDSCFKGFLDLKKRASEQDLELAIVSSFRSFEAQKNIWNKKARGERELLNDQGQPLEYNQLSKEEMVAAILRWSAFPGLSRHHWGTDLDVFDEKALKSYQEEFPDYQIQLVPSEYESGGPFEELGAFLKEELARSEFFRPYEQDLGGVAIEPWHISHLSSKEFMEAMNLSDFLDFLEGPHCQDIELIDVVKEQAEFIFNTYFLNITHGL